VNAFFRESRGQDLAEYCLIAAIIALVALGVLIGVSGGVSGIWKTADAMIGGRQTTSAPAPAPAKTPGTP
jgi:Flp pilus assembly pilin Flp